MADPTPEVPPVDVRKVQKQFQAWRAHKRGRVPIPERLWHAAAKLCEAHRIHRVARWLRLNNTALRDYARRTAIVGSPQPPTFVEWAPPAMPVVAPAAAEYLLEVARAGERTVRVRVRGAAVAEVAALARALRRPSRQG